MAFDTVYERASVIALGLAILSPVKWPDGAFNLPGERAVVCGAFAFDVIEETVSGDPKRTIYVFAREKTITVQQESRLCGVASREGAVTIPAQPRLARVPARDQSMKT